MKHVFVLSSRFWKLFIIISPLLESVRKYVILGQFWDNCASLLRNFVFSHLRECEGMCGNMVRLFTLEKHRCGNLGRSYFLTRILKFSAHYLEVVDEGTQISQTGFCVESVQTGLLKEQEGFSLCVHKEAAKGFLIPQTSLFSLARISCSALARLGNLENN